MSERTIQASRKALVTAGLISLKRCRFKDGSNRVIVTVKSVWGKNHDHFNRVKSTAQNETNVLKSRGAITPAKELRAPPQNSRTNKNKCKKNTLTGNEDVPVGESCANESLARRRSLDKSSRMHSQNAFITGRCQEPDKITATSAAKELLAGLQSKRKVMRRPNVKTWAVQIKQFVGESCVEMPVFFKVLRWYVKHIGDEFVPVAYSAKTFCDKFVSIRDAMERSGVSASVHPPGWVPPECDGRLSESTPGANMVHMTDEQKRAFLIVQDMNDVGADTKEEYLAYIEEMERSQGEAYYPPVFISYGLTDFTLDEIPDRADERCITNASHRV